MLQSDITLHWLHETLKSMHKGKSPGLDGLTVDFYLFSFDEIGQYLLDALNESYQDGILNIDQRRAVIKLIPKKDRDHRYVKNLRPISLLNVDRKILTKLLADRLEAVLSSYIHVDQKGFLPARNLGFNILDIYSVLSLSGEQDIENLLISLDF